MRNDGWLVVLTVSALLFAGCHTSPAPLANGHASAEALATAVLSAVEHRDRQRLDALALSEQEFADHVWPDLPAARPERNLPFSYVWGDLHQKSDISLTRTLQEHGGKAYGLRGVRFGGATPYAGYVVHREATFDVTDAAGAPASLRVCGSFLEKDGAWKVFSYVVSE